MEEFIKQSIKEESDKAVKNGNKYPGYLGVAPDDYSKEELIMLLNILNDELENTKSTLDQYAKRLII